MGILFSKKKHVSRITDQDKAILQVKQARDKIKQHQRRIQQSIEKEKEIAKKLLAKGHKDRALLLLRKKKFQEQILSKTDGQLDNLEQMIHNLEFVQIETNVIDGLRMGNIALKKLQDVLSIEDIERVMDETREGAEKQKEIDEILTGTLTDEDEAEVEVELDILLSADTKVPITGVQLPDIPRDLPVKVKDIVSKNEQKEGERVALEA